MHQTITVSKARTRVTPTPEEARDWRKLALALDRILHDIYQGKEPDEKDINESKLLMAKLGVV